MSVYDFIPLDRTFRALSQEVERDAYDAHDLPFLGEQLPWPELLQRSRVVVLSEAGAGKTAEIREQARQLRQEGKAAFFIRLEHVAAEFESAFEEGDFEGFQAWVAGMDEGWLLLDSVDEARLRSPQDFETAIRKVARRLAPAMSRAHVVITSRPYAWRAKTDLALCEQQFPVAPEQESVADKAEVSSNNTAMAHRTRARRESPFTIVALNDLSTSQVEIFASARGVKDVNAFRDAVERRDAWSFTARPQDLEELLAFWDEKKRIGSRLELMQSSVRRRLDETDPNRAEARPLPFERAETGGRLTAAACVLTRTPTVQVPGGDGAVGVSLGEVLPDWNPKDQATLLGRPVFDEAIYGAVRFHHRSVREYLCAEWFSDLLKRQTSRRSIMQVLFRDQYGLEVVVPETRPVLPWLSLFDERICAKVLELAPEVFFEGGDPSALPVDVRRKILHDVVAQIIAGPVSHSLFDHAAIERFANPDLTDDVKALIATHSANGDVLWFLLRMVWRGLLVGALPEVRAVALNPKTEHSARIAAFRAVGAVGSPSDMEEIRRAVLSEAGGLDRGWLAELVAGLERTPEALVWLFEAIAKAAPKEEYSVDTLSHVLDALVSRLPEDLLASFVDKAAELLNRPPFVERRHCELSETFSWLLRSAGGAALRLIERRSPDALGASVLTVLHKIPVASDFDRGDINDLKSSLYSLVPAWPELNWALFWRLAETERNWLDAKKGERLTEARFVPRWSSFVRLDPEDFDLAIGFINTRTLLDDRLIALSAAFEIYVGAGRKDAWRRRLKRAAACAPELEERLSSLLKPRPLSDETRKMRKMTAGWTRRSRERKEKEELLAETNKRYIEDHLETEVRAPELDPAKGITKAQRYLMDEARQRHDKSGSYYARNTWRALIPEFGEHVARAFREAAMGFWRRTKPQLVSEGAPQNSTLLSTVFGLVGLTIEASETPDWPAALTEQDVELAFRYAMNELNGFPSWLPKLHERFPALIRDLTLNELRFELRGDVADKDGHYLLSDVSWSGQWLWESVAPELLKIVSRREPKNLNNLRQVLAVLQGSSLTDAALAELSSRKAQNIRDLDHAATWFAVWTGVDPLAAIPSLRLRLARIRKRADAVHFAMHFITQLVGSRHARSAARGNYRTPEVLKPLYLLICTYVSQEEDIERAGKGVYSPGLRDDAQDARNHLFSQLRDVAGKAAFTAMMEIAADHPDPSFRPWALRHARAKAEGDANGEPWSARQVREFADVLERTPADHRQLFDLAVLRLEDLKADLEEGDASEAPVLMRVKDETELRNVLGSRLRLTALGRYSVVQEEEFADAKRADLRFHAPALDAPVPAELKLSHRWTATSLFERLENQLCGDYLRDVRSGRGLFLLVHQGKQQTWTLPDGSKADFAGLVNALATHWAAIAGRFPGIDEVKVLGIDLTKRRDTAKAAAPKPKFKGVKPPTSIDT